MGIFGMIARKKAQFQDATVQVRKRVILRRAEKVQQDNIRQAELTAARQELQQAEIINKDLRAEAPRGPNKLMTLGQNMAQHMEKGKKQYAPKRKPRVGAIPSSGSRGFESSGQGSPFGGQRNLDVGAEKGSPFNQKPRRIL